MIKSIYAHNVFSDSGHLYFKVDVPTLCPHCGVAIDPKEISANYANVNKGDVSHRVFLGLLCTNCLRAFTAEYEHSLAFDESSCIGIYPELHTNVEHSKEIQELSPMFVQVYSEAHRAEESNLKEICGMGYRKALEFLIKDYAICLHSDKEEEIKKTPLAKCIEKYIDSNRIKTLATASAWLGNDETHYVRKHEDYDLNHLKSFIKATEAFIDSEMQAIKADELLSKPK